MQLPLIPVLLDPEHKQRCRNLAIRLGCHLLLPDEVGHGEFPWGAMVLCFDNKGRLGLTELAKGRKLPAVVDFLARRINHGIDPLMRAIGYKTRNLIDCTAGFGVDTAHIAAQGIKVIAIERNPVMFALLEDAYGRCSGSSACQNLALRSDNCIHFLEQLNDDVDVIYIDPMYPPKPGSAAPKKALRFLQQLNPRSDDQPGLVELARSRVSRRVVVKRPHYAEPLAPGKSGETIGKLVRFDIYSTTK
jgi:16S rRNA (guanine1516-N2)-methyltransferase